MALLGFHIVFSLIAATLFNKFQPQFTLCERLIYAGLTYYWIPEPPDANDARVRRRGRNRGDAAAPDYRRQLITLVLDKTIVSRMSYYPSLVWLVDYSFVAVLVFAACQLFIRLFPWDTSTNVSVLWTIFSFAFALQILFRLLWKKFTNPHLSPERNLIFSFSFVIFLVFMLLNMFGEHFVDESLAHGYRVLSERMKLLAREDASLDVRGGSPLFLFISASFATALLGAAFLMPVIQYSTLYRSTVDGQKTLWTAVHHSVFLLPLFILPLFIRTIQAQILLQVPGLTHELFVAVRLLLVVVWAVGRVATVRPLLQTYLENARERAMGCSKHADGFDILRSHLSYVCATSLQLLAPPLAIFFIAFTLLSLGKIYPMNDVRAAANGAPDHFSVLLAPEVQRALWTNGLFTGLTLHTLMSMTTVAFGI
ncbi:Transmembrane protein 161A/B family-containing protein [Aphelenchoides fujianensis]|nr:Transmembrane protein 161A/B family-containing protein [Aphelenchoides fujianensis]